LATNVVNVVLGRESGKNESLREWLPPGATVSEVPLTTTTYFDPAAVRTDLEKSRAHGMYRTLVVTSARSADYVDVARLSSTMDVAVVSVGPSTTAALTSRGVHVHVQGESSAESLAHDIVQSPVLILGATAMREELATALRDKGLEVTSIACYATAGVALTASDITTLGDADVLFVGAPSAWAVARDHVRDETWVVVPGTSTGDAVRIEHSKVIEGWGPELRTRLTEVVT
jgi:uroporphyrinogen-III synthase